MVALCRFKGADTWVRPYVSLQEMSLSRPLCQALERKNPRFAIASEVDPAYLFRVIINKGVLQGSKRVYQALD